MLCYTIPTKRHFKVMVLIGRHNTQLSRAQHDEHNECEWQYDWFVGSTTYDQFGRFTGGEAMAGNAGWQWKQTADQRICVQQ